MRSRAILSALLISLIPFSAAFSEETAFKGEVGVTGMYLDVHGRPGGRAKFAEYRDMVESLKGCGTAGIRSDSDSRFLKFDAFDLGYGTQRCHGSSGSYGKFKIDLSYDQSPHNAGFYGRIF